MIQTCLICTDKKIRFYKCLKCSQQLCMKCFTKHRNSRKNIDGVVKCVFCNHEWGKIPVNIPDKDFTLYYLIFMILIIVLAIILLITMFIALIVATIRENDYGGTFIIVVLCIVLSYGTIQTIFKCLGEGSDQVQQLAQP